MTQVNAPTEVPAAAPADAAPPAGPTPGAATPAPAAEDMIGVPRGSLGEWEGSWHKVVEAANKHRDLGPMGDFAQEVMKAGYSPAQVREALIQAERAGALGEPAPPPAQPSLTQAHLDAMEQRIGEKFGTALTERDATNEQRTQQQADIRTAQENEVKFRDETLVAMGYPLEDKDGNPNVPAGLVKMAFDRELNKVLVEGKPDGLDEQALETYYASPTKEHLEAAAKAIENLKGLKYDMSAIVATEQEQTPSATLGDGPAGPQAQPGLSDMTPEQRVEAITDGVDIDNPDDPPDS